MFDLLKHMGKNTAWHQVSNKQVASFILVYERNHYFGLGPIPKPKLADIITDTETTFQRKNPITDSMGYYFYHTRAPKTKFAAKY